MRFKISDNAKKEFDFYKNSELDMIGKSVEVKEFRKEFNLEEKKYSALECWWAFDTHGKKYFVMNKRYWKRFKDQNKVLIFKLNYGLKILKEESLVLFYYLKKNYLII